MHFLFSVRYSKTMEYGKRKHSQNVSTVSTSLSDIKKALPCWQKTWNLFTAALIKTALVSGRVLSAYTTLWQKKVEWTRRIPFHRVAALSAFGIEEGNPFRDCIDSLLIDFDYWTLPGQHLFYFSTSTLLCILLAISWFIQLFFYQSA